MNTKKKILFLVTQSEFGGAQRFIYRLVTNLDLDKYDIIVAAGPEGNDANGLLFTLKKQGFETFGLKFLRRGVNPLFDFGLGLIEIYNLIRKQRPDILFLCSSKAGAMGSLSGRLLKVPKIIYRIGGWTFNDPRPYLIKLYYKFIEKFSAKWKDVIINNAESDRQQAIKMGIEPRDKIITIHNGIDINKLEFFTKEEARNLLNIQPGFVVGAIANFYPPKGLKYLIEAANILRYKIQDTRYKILIIGEGRERKKLENLIKKYNLEDKFFLIGLIPEAYKYLRAFDIFVLPSVKEGFPWTIIEAMTAELAIVVTRVGAVPEIIEHNKDGLIVEPGNSEELAKAISKLLADKNLREKLAIEARKTVEKKFTLEKMIKEFEKLFWL